MRQIVRTLTIAEAGVVSTGCSASMSGRRDRRVGRELEHDALALRVLNRRGRSTWRQFSGTAASPMKRTRR